MELTIELVGRGSRHYDLQHVSGEQISIGRSFDNDIVLSDPHVCPHHAVIETDEHGDVHLRDLDSVNGTFTHKHEALNNAIAIRSGDEFILGKSRIRIYQRDHAVPESIRLNWVEKLAHIAGNPVFAAGVILLAALMSLFFQYANTSREFNFSREIITVIGIILLISLWPACWTLFSRMKKHESHFVAQLSTTLVYVILITLYQKFDNWLAFHFGIYLPITLLDTAVLLILSLLLIWFNYYLSVFQTDKKRWTYTLGLTCLLGSFVYLVNSFDSDRFKRRPEYAANLYLPSLTFYSTQAIDQYLTDAEYIFTDSAKMVEEE